MAFDFVGVILQRSDNAYIPNDQEYLEWKEAGNTPDPPGEQT